MTPPLRPQLDLGRVVLGFGAGLLGAEVGGDGLGLVADLKAARGAQARADFGAFFLLDVGRNAVKRMHLDPEEMGRDLGVLQEWERVAEG